MSIRVDKMVVIKTENGKDRNLGSLNWDSLQCSYVFKTLGYVTLTLADMAEINREVRVLNKQKQVEMEIARLNQKDDINKFYKFVDSFYKNYSPKYKQEGCIFKYKSAHEDLRYRKEFVPDYKTEKIFKFFTEDYPKERV